ncbi:hypothetical protein LCM23_25445 [Cytobacillus kochii]|uniref:phage tail assembly chaperone G n=1 Tax=Cytobacillus kochii TaxID=859143 RepID=UPI001CD64BBF|nr:hypothetical protein [Cytobacillus kochii]MCA1029360.1 hypothetical protein [Cytobacillus kochii]
MANLKRNMIELVTNPEEAATGAEVETKKYWTPAFVPMSVTYQAADLITQIEKPKEGEEIGERELIEKLIEFTVNDIYKGQFTREELESGLHAPDAITTLQEQILFIAQGQQSESTKKFLEKKN